MKPMASVPSVANLPSRESKAAQTLRQRFVDFVLHRRVRITVAVFLLLIIEDVLVGFRPHDLLNLRDAHTSIGLAMVLGGLAMRTWAAGILHKHKELTTIGPYALIRHPLYTGSFIMMIGFAVLIDDPENIWLIVGPVLAMYILRAIHEERLLSKNFPSQWEAYAKAVPRFFPYRWPKGIFAPWKLAQWVRNREYQAVIAVMLGLVAIEAWSRF